MRLPAPRGSARLRPRPGDAIVEALVATILLTVGALALLALNAVHRRDERRAATRVRAAALLAERLADWRAAPCDQPGGTRDVGGLRESWTTRRDSDSLEVLADTLVAPDDPRFGRVGVAALRRCEP